MPLKQRQGHQTYNDNIDPKQGYNHAKFERSCFDGVLERKQTNKQNKTTTTTKTSKQTNKKTCFFFIITFFKRGSMSIISLEHVQNPKTVACA